MMDNYDVHNENDNNGGGGELAVLFAVLAATPALIKNVKKILEEIGTFPTVPTKVVNNHVMWNTLAKCNGWELQQNLLTQHCRIIDPDNVRRAWGTHDAMEKALKSLQNIK